jgi:hypothetical protein
MYMKKNTILFAAGLSVLACLTGPGAAAQKAWQGSLNSLMGRVPQSGDCEGGYGLCDHTTDDRKIVTITGLNSQFTDLEKQMMEAASGVMTGAMPEPGSAPSAEQIEAMKQQAMAKMTAAQNMTPQQAAQMHKQTGSLPTTDTAYKYQIAQAQAAAIQITRLINELSQKMNKLQNGWDSVKMGAPCADVFFKSLAAPPCKCVVARNSKYQSERTAALNSYLAAVANLAHQYMGQIRPLLATVDDMEAKVKYGDALVDPSNRQIVVMMQRQAMNGVSSILSLYGRVAKDGAEQWARQLNAALNPGGCNPV